MSDNHPARYYYINNETKEILYFLEEPGTDPEGYIFAGMSQLPIKGAAGYYAKNQQGYTLVNGDKANERNSENDQEDQEAIEGTGDVLSED